MTHSKCFILFIALGIAGCASQAPLVEVAPADLPVDQMTQVHFVSARAVLEAGEESIYGASRATALTAGVCHSPTRESRVDMIAVSQDLKKMIAEVDGHAGDDRLVLYVHGFNESFEKSCRRAARLSRNLGIAGRLVMFSWPANNRFWEYRDDLEDLSWTVEPLAQLIDQFIETAGPDRLVLMGHSLGARGILEAMLTRPLPESSDERIARVILMAPDVARKDFLAEHNEALAERAREIIVYVSRRDHALAVSSSLHREPRLGSGRVAPANPNTLIVDASATRRHGITGHMYFLKSPAVIEHLRQMVHRDSGPVSGTPRDVFTLDEQSGR